MVSVSSLQHPRRLRNCLSASASPFGSMFAESTYTSRICLAASSILRMAVSLFLIDQISRLRELLICVVVIPYFIIVLFLSLPACHGSSPSLRFVGMTVGEGGVRVFSNTDSYLPNTTKKELTSFYQSPYVSSVCRFFTDCSSYPLSSIQFSIFMPLMFLKSFIFSVTIIILLTTEVHPMSKSKLSSAGVPAKRSLTFSSAK